MHTMRIDGGYVVTYDGDFSGDIRIRKPDETVVRVPFHVLEEIVAEKVRADWIDALEQMSTKGLLAGHGPLQTIGDQEKEENHDH